MKNILEQILRNKTAEAGYLNLQVQKRKAKIIKIEEAYYISFKFSIKMLLGYVKMTKRAYIKL